jgi:polygalacturonase
VRVEGITLRNSPGWVQHYLACDDLAIRGIRVFSHANYNNDMMDVDCCRDVRISDCVGDTGDDAITLKSTADRACENITITNCVVSSHCNAIKLGTESNGGFKNIVISNCVVRPSQSNQLRHGAKAGLAGIALEVVDGGTLDRVTISNITITGAKSPLFLRLGNRARPFLAGGPRPGMGSFRNVAISNVVAADVSEIGCAIAGLPGHPIENVTLSNVSITFAGGGTKDQASATVPEKPEGYPECTMFGVLPAYGFYCRHVDGLTLSNVDVRWATPDLRPALICDDVKDLQVDALRGRSSADGVPVVMLNDVRGAMLRGCVAPPACKVFLRMQGRTEAVSATGNDLSATVTPFEFAGQTGTAALHQTGNR